MLFRSNKSKAEQEPDAKGGANVSDQKSTAQAKPDPANSAEIKQRVAKSKQLHAAFGEIVSLLMRAPQLKAAPLSSLEEVVVPAIVTGQFMIAEAQAKQSGFMAPVAVVLWATVSEDVDRRLSESPGNRAKLAPADWKSGTIPWLILAAGDVRLINVLRERIEKTVLGGRSLKVRKSETKGVDDAAATSP